MFYDYKAEDIHGNQVSMDQYKGKVVMVVNSATQCGFTPQYEDIENLYEKYHEQGLEVLEFPCNQFGNQAPESDEEIASMCTLRFGVKYDRFKKVDVNGENAHPLFTYLESQKGFQGFHKEHPLYDVINNFLRSMDPDLEKTPTIKWNFTKFILDRDGNVVERLEPTAGQDLMEEAIKKYL